jgi:predicted transposase YbfD/YdcC
MRSVPSHDTFNRLFQCLDAGLFAKCLTGFPASLRAKVCAEVVAFDGKAHRRTGSGDAPALHMLNAWAADNRLVLGQLAVDGKSNEITAMPALMDALELEGCVVTADALNTQKAVAAKAVEKKADYMLALKENHPLMYAEVSAHMDDLALRSPPGFEEAEKDHGRIETRRCWQSEATGWFADKGLWAGLRSFVLIESERTLGGITKTSRRYYISSLPRDEGKAAKCVRKHWLVENALHWCLDVVFDEDQSRARIRNAAKNLGCLRAMCLNLVKRMPGKHSMRSKMFQMALNPDILINALREL